MEIPNARFLHLGDRSQIDSLGEARRSNERAAEETSREVTGQGRMKERRRERCFGFFQKTQQNWLKNPIFCRKGLNDKKLTNLSPESQKIFKRVPKGKYT